MANVYATKTGNWNDPTVWNTGALPEPTDDVYSNGFVVTVNTSPTILSIRNESATGISSGGGFTINAGITLTCTGEGCVANAANASNLLRIASAPGQTRTIISNLLGPTNSTSRIIDVFSATGGTINITGNILCRGSNSSNMPAAIELTTQSLNVNITGDITGSTTQTAVSAITFSSTGGVLLHTGNLFGSVGPAITSSGTSTISITGNLTGGGSSAALVNGATCTITGTVTGGTGSAGAGFTNSGTLTHIGSAFASASAPAIGVGSASQVTILTGPLVSTSGTGVLAAASGVNPCSALRWFVKDTALSTFTYIMRGATASGSPSERPERVLALPEGYAAGYPLPSDVRAPVTYGPAALYTGTCAVPAPSSVVAGVAVDDTVGTAFINPADVWNVQFSTVNGSGTIGERLGKSATIDSTGAQIIALGA